MDNGTISKAAESLEMAQPTLSAQIKSLEDSLGFDLFTRRGKKLELTNQGKVAYEYAKNIFSMGTEMLESLQGDHQDFLPSLHIGALDSISKDIVARLVKTSSKFGPCKIKMIEGGLDFLVNELTTHKLDLILTTFLPHGENSTELTSKKISKKNIYFYGSEKFKDLKKNFPQSITGVPLIFPSSGFKLRNDLEDWAKLNGVNLNIQMEIQDVSLKKLIANSGLGIFASAAHTVSEEVKNKTLYKIGELSDVYEEIYLVTGKKNIPNHILKHILSNFS